MVSAVDFIPGPNAAELAIHIGQLRGKAAALVVAGACFIVPAMLVSILLAWAYVNWGSLPRALSLLRTIAAAIVTVVAVAMRRFGRAAVRDGVSAEVAPAAAAAAAAYLLSQYPRLQPEIPLLAAAALLGGACRGGRRRTARTLSFALPALFWGDRWRLVLALPEISATLFGSGDHLVSCLQSEPVDRLG